MNKKVFIFFSWMTLLLVFKIEAQSVLYHVQVLDGIHMDPLIGANIVVGKAVYVTDIDGYSQFESSRTDIIISYIGYEDKRINLTSLKPVNKDVYIIGLNPIASLLETATISSSRYEVSLAEATVSLELIKPELISDNNLVSMDQVLDKIPGVQMVGDQVNIRGGSGFSYGAGSRVMLLIDDMPALTMDGGYPNWNDVPLENISQVEILKGAASSLYGSAALNGIINIRTGMPTTEPITNISIAYTTFGSPKNKKSKWWTKAPFGTYLSFLDKRKVGKLDMVWNGNYYYLDSYKKGVVSNRGRIGFKTRYRLTDKLSLSLNGLYNKAENSDFFIWKNDVETYEPLEGAESASSIDRWQLDPIVQYISEKGYNHYWKNRLSSISNRNQNNKSVIAISYFTEYQLKKRIPIVGIDAVAGMVFSIVNSKSDLYGGGKYQFSNRAMYIQLNKKLLKRLNVTLGTRYEYNRLVTLDQDVIKPSVGSRSVSRIGLNYKLHKARFLRASWGQGYRFPTLAERFIKTNIGALVIFPNNSLKSETGWTSEIGLKQGLRLGAWEGFIDVAGFYQAYQDMMEFSFVFRSTEEYGFQSQNVGDTKISGVEVSLGSQSKIGGLPISIIAGYTYLNPRYNEFIDSTRQGSSVNYNILKYRSRHSFKMDIGIKKGSTDIGLSYQAISPVEAIDLALQRLPVVGDFARIKAYRAVNNKTRHLLNFRTGYHWKKYKFMLILENVLNQAYTLRPGLMEAPRSITFKVNYGF